MLDKSERYQCVVSPLAIDSQNITKGDTCQTTTGITDRLWRCEARHVLDHPGKNAVPASASITMKKESARSVAGRRYASITARYHENQSCLANGKNHWHRMVYSIGSIGKYIFHWQNTFCHFLSGPPMKSSIFLLAKYIWKWYTNGIIQNHWHITIVIVGRIIILSLAYHIHEPWAEW